MHRIIQINIGGQLIPMEDEAYLQLKSYLSSLNHQFAHDAGKAEIMEDIEARIAELFQLRLQSNVQAITMEDVRKVCEKLGAAHELGSDDYRYKQSGLPTISTIPKGSKRLYRHPSKKMIAGVSAGIADYFGIDPVLVRLAFFLTAFFALGGLITYIVCWIIFPMGTAEDVANSERLKPDYEGIKQNVLNDLNDLKQRAEKMSVELQDWFKRQKW